MTKCCVVKISGKNTAKVSMVEVKLHPLYKKVLRKKKMLLCHYENIELSVGDNVDVVECRPFSKMKKHIVLKKL